MRCRAICIQRQIFPCAELKSFGGTCRCCDHQDHRFFVQASADSAPVRCHQLFSCHIAFSRRSKMQRLLITNKKSENIRSDHAGKRNQQKDNSCSRSCLRKQGRQARCPAACTASAFQDGAQQKLPASHPFIQTFMQR